MLRKAFVLLALFVVSSSLVYAQTTNPNQQRPRSNDFAIRGKVIIPNQYVTDERIEVRLETGALQLVQTVYTDSAGNFEFRSLGAGSYFISISLEGYEPVHQSVEVFNSFGTATVTIMLNKPAIEIRERLAGLDAADPDIVDVGQMKENFPKKAVQDYEKAIEEKQKGRIESALKLLQEAIQIAPNFFHAHNNLGILFQSMKRYPDAEREYKRSHDLSPKTDRPLVNLGGLYIEQANQQKGDPEARGKLLDHALDALEEAVKINPRSAGGQFLLGQANYQSNFFEEAETAFKRARSIDPHLASAQLMLANVYMKLQKWQDVIGTLDEYLKDNPKASDRASVEEMRERIAKSLQAAK